jgi:hypothetical protein
MTRRQVHLTSLLCMVVLFASGLARAWPVDWIQDVEVGKERFVRLPSLDWFEVEDPAVAQVEWLESGELLLSGLKAGRTLVLLGSEGKVAAWRVRVGVPSNAEPASFFAAQKACPGFTAAPLEAVKLTVTVRDEPCRKALLTLFQTDAFEARHLELTFEGKVLQQQLVSLQEALRPLTQGRVTARYVGAGLVLEGPVSAAEHRRVLWAVLRRTLGRFALDDQLLVAPPPDAGH